MALMDRVIGPSVTRILGNILNTVPMGQMTHAGVQVNENTPFTINAVRSAISVLSQDVASTPLELWVLKPAGRIAATNHPLYDVLALAPNPRMTAFEWRESAMVALLTWGNSYNYIQRDNLARVTALWPLRPDCMTVYLEDGRIKYHYKPKADDIPEQTFEAFDILHIKGMSGDGLVGRTPLFDLREKFGEINATERFSQSFYGNGMKRSAVLKVPGQLSPVAYERLKTSIEKESGVNKAWKTLILEEGMDFGELSFAPEDAQLLDTRNFGVEEVCRAFNLPAYKLRISKPGAVAYASVEAQQLDYLLSTLNGWYVRFEQAIDRACLSLAERGKGLHVRHNTRTMLRADMKTQAEAAKLLRDMSATTINEIRAEFGYNPSDDPRADDLFAPTYVQATTAMTEEQMNPDIPEERDETGADAADDVEVPPAE